jgi:two-component system CheB/CheR fusion protein
VRVNSDLHNLLENAQLAIVIVSRELRIRHFTPRAEHLLNIIPSDLGRPIGQIRPNLEIEDLERTIRHVVERVEPFESEVRGDRGRRWLSLRIRPYKDIENRIDGAVLSLLDVTPLKTQEQEAARARELADAIVDSVRDSLLLLDADLRVTRANDAFYDCFGVRTGETIGSFLWELGNGQWNIPGLRQLLLEVLPKNTRVDDFAVEHDFPGLGRRRVSVSARRLRSSPQEEILLALRFEGI